MPDISSGVTPPPDPANMATSQLHWISPKDHHLKHVANCPT